MTTSISRAFPDTTRKNNSMKKRTIAALLAVVAIAVAVPLTFAHNGGYGLGMMGGYGGYGMGPAMMYGYGGDLLSGLNLTTEQREKVAKIQEGLATKHWELMGKMQQQQFALRGLLASGTADDAAIGKAYKNLDSLRQQMWTAGTDAQKQMDTVLTKSQREQLQRSLGGDAK